VGVDFIAWEKIDRAAVIWNFYVIVITNQESW